MMGMGSEEVASGIHINQLYLGKQKLDGCGVRQNQVGLTQPIPNNIGLRGYASQWKETKTYITKTGGETKTQNLKNSLAAPMGISPRSRNIIHQQEEFLKNQEHIVSSKKIEKLIYLQS